MAGLGLGDHRARLAKLRRNRRQPQGLEDRGLVVEVHQVVLPPQPDGVEPQAAGGGALLKARHELPVAAQQQQRDRKRPMRHPVHDGGHAVR
ncbi:hypothetical protein D3C78_1776530 [compost metagenome]